MNDGAVLLASYPKSGNTWIRAFLTALWRDGRDVDINNLLIANASSREILDSLVGMPSADFSAREIADLRPHIYGYATRESSVEGRVYLKMHDAYMRPSESLPIPICREHIDRVLYVVRDPRAVALSLARHLRIAVDDAIRVMADCTYQLSSYPRRVGRQVAQFLSSWSIHVESWIEAPGVPIFLIRYEDLVTDPEASFKSILQFLGEETSIETFHTALEGSQFKLLQEKERQQGFSEKPAGEHRFFHGGMPQSWQSELTPAQVTSIVQTHGRVMKRLNYSV